MVDDLKQTNGLPRLNPFAFPSDTDFRFFLLIVSVLAAGLFIYNSLYYSVPSNSSNFIQTLRRCTQESEAAFPGTDLNARIARNNFFEQCRKQQEQIQALWIIGGVLILLFVGSLIYLTFPWRKVKKEKLVPFTELDSPEAVSLLKDLCREAGLSRQPDFVWNPLNLTSSGSAFGILGRYKIALGGGLVTKFFTDRPAFRAVVLHELGHISNGDINKTYFAVAIWQSFLLVGVLPLALSQLGSNNELDFIFALTWRTFALAGLVYLTRNAVLRAREVYADLRATLWEGTTSVIERVIGELISQKKNLFYAITDLHPVPAERRKVLENTDRLFRLGYWEAFGTGIIATISFPNVLSVLSLLLPVNVSANATLFATLIFGPLAVEVVGLQIWRASFAALMRGKTLRGVGRLGLCFGFGIVLGRLLAFDSAFVAIEEQTDFAIQIVNIGYGIIWSGILCASLFFLMRWIAMGAKGWLEIAIHELSPRPIYLAGLFIASIVLTVWLSTLFQSRDLG
ncbi:MAG: M48 family metalloprotease, partial [Chloroflexi bacterium]|nr:M48 family metalloprotease [Chloroflexota bacterium]